MKLELKKLISSRLFGELIRSEEHGFKNRIDYILGYEKLRNNYDDFIKQKLTIWMFVPCKLVDGVWVVLEEPLQQNYVFEDHPELAGNPKEYDLELFENDIKEYQEAKDRVLFANFKYDKMGFAYSTTQSECVFDEEYMESKTIEDLVKYNLELTPTAKKLIGL